MQHQPLKIHVISVPNHNGESQLMLPRDITQFLSQWI